MEIKSVIIVGGGSAGWMTATTLLKILPDAKISLIESPKISTIGVGESTIQPITEWCNFIGIDPHKFLKETEGSYKLSIKFTDFYKKGEAFHYPFGLPTISQNLFETNDWWYKKLVYPETPNSDYADSIYPTQMAYVNANKINPNKIAYAFHFDATKFGTWLRKNKCQNINHIKENIDTIEQDENGIASLNNKYKADLYIDCTGFRSLLLGQTLKEPFESYEDLLPNNSAWATKIKYKNKEKELVPYTNCTAIENGWVWNIPLWSRIGTGYVYSNKFVDDDTALKEFKNHLGTDQAEFKNIKMKVGIHNRLWVKNVVAIGLSAGFIEPLESNGLFSVHEFLKNFMRNIRRKKISQWDKDNFNYMCKMDFRTFAEFVALHYALSHRTDTEYWKANFNKQWDKNLINCEPVHVAGIRRAAEHKRYSYKFPSEGGFHCIAAGMNWSPTELNTIKWFEGKNYSNTESKWLPYITNMKKRKEKAEKEVKEEPTLYNYLKENVYEK
jgi:tryptophan halogenase